MKHEAVVTTILVVIFAVSQIVGLYLVGESMEEVTCEVVDGQNSCLASFEETAIGERPQLRNIWAVVYIVLGVGIGTGILLLLARFGRVKIWKLWFFSAVWITSAIALAVLFPDNMKLYPWIVALLITAWKVFKPNMLIYNLTEVLMYSGMAVLLVPMFYIENQANEFMSIWPILLLLLLISLYDMYAVWKSKHMITMAKFITSSNSFAGLMVPYKVTQKKLTMALPKESHKVDTLQSTTEHKNAILGGGDVTFPLLFAGTVLQARTIEYVRAGLPFMDALFSAYLHAILIGAGAMVAIALLFIMAKKDKFYPAMPFVTAGCLIGWGLSFLF